MDTKDTNENTTSESTTSENTTNESTLNKKTRKEKVKEFFKEVIIGAIGLLLGLILCDKLDLGRYIKNFVLLAFVESVILVVIWQGFEFITKKIIKIISKKD